MSTPVRPKAANHSNAHSTSVRNVRPTAIAEPAHSAIPAKSAPIKRRGATFNIPARGAATALKPGMNFATNRDFKPFRWKNRSVRWTQESGDREREQSRRRMGRPCDRPSWYQIPSPPRAAITHTMKITGRRRCNGTAKAAATRITG